MHIAVIGCGYWGPNLVRNFIECPACTFVTCCDLDEKKLLRIKAKYPTVNCISDYDSILKDTDIVGVAIATPISTHFILARKALLAGKHVFVEKPLTSTSAQAKDLISLSELEGRILMVGHTFEYSPPVIKIKEIIRSGTLGTIYFISTSRVNLGLHQKDVSVIWDLAPHDFSILLAWLEEQPVRVCAIGQDCIVKGIHDVAFISLVFPSKIIAHIEVSWLAPSKLRRTTIVGSKKMLVYDDTESVEKVKIFDQGVNYRDPETFGEYHLSYRAGDIWSPHLPSFEPLQTELTHFLDCIKNGNRPRTDAYSGLHVVRLLEAAERSLRNGGHLEEVECGSWPPQNSTNFAKRKEVRT